MTDVHWPWPPPKTETTFSDSGPECPNCHSIMHTDEPFFFDESGFEIECAECDVMLSVRPQCSYVWYTQFAVPGGSRFVAGDIEGSEI
jgi:hypothetical protein